VILEKEPDIMTKKEPDTMTKKRTGHIAANMSGSFFDPTRAVFAAPYDRRKRHG